MIGKVTSIRPDFLELISEKDTPYVALVQDCEMPLSVRCSVTFNVKIEASNCIRERRRWLYAKNVRPL